MLELVLPHHRVPGFLVVVRVRRDPLAYHRPDRLGDLLFDWFD
ncbi:hypothetical protein ABT346_02475 [Micromonospora peucetia]